MVDGLVHVALLILMPLPMLGLINRVKSIAAGRKGPPILQPVYDVVKLLQKGAVYSRTTTWLFVAGPIVALASSLLAALIVPLASTTSPFGFPADVFVFAYLLGVGRFFTMTAALDTGSAFEGMGASREAAYAALAEPALFLALMIVCIPAHSASFSDAFASIPAAGGLLRHPGLLLATLSLGVVLLAEASRIPVDDPNTHLELTMIHEVMVLDHGGPDFAFIQIGYALKFFVLGAVLVHLVLPIPASGWMAPVLFVAGQAGVAITVGIIESFMARLRLTRVPQFLIGACVVAAVGVLVLFTGGRP
jgi:formate hydrogenlyase subunit 4